MSTSDERPQKNKLPLAAVSTSPVVTRTLMEATGLRQWLLRWKCGIQAEILVGERGVVVVGFARKK